MGFIENLKEGRGEGDEEGGGSPKESAVGENVGPSVPGCQVRGDGVTESLHHRSEEGQEAQPGLAPNGDLPPPLCRLPEAMTHPLFPLFWPDSPTRASAFLPSSSASFGFFFSGVPFICC